MRSVSMPSFHRLVYTGFALCLAVLLSGSAFSQTFESDSRRISQKNPFQTLIEKIVENTHPSVLGAKGTGQLLAREMPVVMQRLRDTRSAIEALGDEDFQGREVSTQDHPFAFIEDPSDRKVLIRDLENLQYLFDELEVALASGDAAAVERFRLEIDRKNKDVDRILGAWGHEIEDEPEDDFVEKPILSGVWSSSYGDVHWFEGWYGSENKTLTTQSWTQEDGAWVLTGTWGRKNSSRSGGFEFRFEDTCSFTGSWWYESSPNSRTGWSGSCKQ